MIPSVDLLWYGRLAVWLGAAILLIQAVLNRGAGVTTAIGALILSVGLIAFLIGLALPQSDGPGIARSTRENLSEDQPLDGGSSKP